MFFYTVLNKTLPHLRIKPSELKLNSRDEERTKVLVKEQVTKLALI